MAVDELDEDDRSILELCREVITARCEFAVLQWLAGAVI